MVVRKADKSHRFQALPAERQRRAIPETMRVTDREGARADIARLAGE